MAKEILLNLSQHVASDEQIQDGVVEPNAKTKQQI